MSLQAFLGGLGAMLGWGGSDFFVKSVVEKVGALRTLIWVQIIGALLIFSISIFSGSSLSINNSFWGGLVIFGAIDALGYWLFFKAIENGKVSIVGPIFACYAAGAIIFSVLLGEKISLITGLFIGFMFFGIILSAIEKVERNVRSKLKNKSSMLAFMAAIVFSAWYPLWERFSGTSDNWLGMTFWLRIGVALFLIGIVLLKRSNLYEKKWGIDIWKWLSLGGIFDASAYMALTWGYMSTIGTSVTTILGSAYSLPTLILAKVFLGERLNNLQKTGVGIILLSLVGMGLSS